MVGYEILRGRTLMIRVAGGNPEKGQSPGGEMNFNKVESSILGIK